MIAILDDGDSQLLRITQPLYSPAIQRNFDKIRVIAFV